MRGTGGTKILKEGEVTRERVTGCILEQLDYLYYYAKRSGFRLDLGEVSVETKWVMEGKALAVSVSADLYDS